jgi:hypothetical protein
VDVDRLFSLPLSDFVTARNELARSLKARGDKETASRIQKIPKPSISAWAINQLARNEPERIGALLSALDRQRVLQTDGLNGGVDRNAMKESKQAENDALVEIERRLPAILEAGGHGSGRAAIERAIKSIRAAAIHPEGRPLLENGHLTVDFDALGFDALGASMTEAPPKLYLVPPPVEEKRREKEERLEALKRQRIEAQEKIAADQQLRAERTRLLAEEKRLEAEVARAKAELARAKESLERAEDQAARVKQALENLEEER